MQDEKSGKDDGWFHPKKQGNLAIFVSILLPRIKPQIRESPPLESGVCDGGKQTGSWWLGPGLGGGAEDRGMPVLVHESGMFVLTD